MKQKKERQEQATPFLAGLMIVILILMLILAYVLQKRESFQQDAYQNIKTSQNQKGFSDVEVDDSGSPIEISDESQIFSFNTPEGSEIQLDNFSDMYLVGSPFILQGTAPESWFIKEEFPVEILNQSGALVQASSAKYINSGDSVFNFKLNVEFEVPDPAISETGFLRLLSGEEESKDIMEFPIMFQ